MKTRLKRSVIEHLASVRLSDERLARLEAVQREPFARGAWRNRALQVFVAACLFAAIAVSWLPTGQSDVLHAIAEEAVMNHLKHRPLEVHGATVAALEDHFDELGFSLVESLDPGGAAQLLGGRYCRLQGVTAAQLRQVDRHGRTQSLFQLPYRPATMGPLPDAARGDAPRTLQVRGIHVELWIERGLLLALTRG